MKPILAILTMTWLAMCAPSTQASDGITAIESTTLAALQSASDAPIAAVNAEFPVEAGLMVRLTIYDSEENFLETPFAKRAAPVGPDGVAYVLLYGLEPGDYAIAAYLDENGDGVLNRGSVLGRPKEPIAFSNGARPSLRAPRFSEARVILEPGSVITITLRD